MADPADQRTADRETIARALCRQWAGAERSLDEVVAPGRALWQRFLPEADAVLAVLVPADLIRAEALEAAARALRGEFEPLTTRTPDWLNVERVYLAEAASRRKAAGA